MRTMEIFVKFFPYNYSVNTSHIPPQLCGPKIGTLGKDNRDDHVHKERLFVGWLVA